METRIQDKLHVAIIMDANGRWAEQRGLPRAAGHRAGSDAVARTIRAALDHDVGALTLFAFSSDNWKRPEPEITALIATLTRFFRGAPTKLVDQGVRISVIGRRDRLPVGLARAIADAEEQTKAGERLHLRIAIDYSSRFELMKALLDGVDAAHLPERMGTRDVDLLIRTGGEQRLSDFMLWECAYAELYFTPVKWPDFAERDLVAALEDFAGRERRFGNCAASAA